MRQDNPATQPGPDVRQLLITSLTIINSALAVFLLSYTAQTVWSFWQWIQQTF